MPRVAIYDNQVGIARTTDAKFRPGYVGDSGLGRGLQRLGAGLGEAAEQEQRNRQLFAESTAKQADVQADTRLRGALYEGEGGFYNLKGAAAIDAKGRVVEELGKIRSETIASLNDPLAKRLFGEAFDARMRNEYVRIAQHEQRELTTYGTQQAQARQGTARDNALLHVDDPDTFGSFVATGEREIEAEGRLSGWGADMVALKKREFRSGIRTDAIAERAISDPVGAAAYMVTHAADLTAEDAAKLQRGLRAPLMERQAAADVDGLMNTSTGAMVPITAPTITPGSGNLATQMVAITAFSESRNRETDPKTGKRITSPAGAEGIMQVMPGTQRDPGYGVKPSNGTPEDDARVGRDYLAAMMRVYKGDPAKAWAAYNWGPGNLDAAIARHGDAWLSHAPPETRDYVATNVAALGGKRGEQATFAPRRDDLGALYDAIDRQPWDYERKKLAREEVDRRVARDDRLKARDEADAKDAAYSTIMALGEGFTSINQIPMAIRNRLSVEAQRSLIDEAEQNAKPKAVKANGDKAIQLTQLAALNPEAFVKTDLRTYRPYLTAAEYASLAQDQAKMQAKPEERTNYSSINAAINFYGKDAGIKANDEDGQAIFTLMRNTLNTVTEGRRQPTDAEIKVAFDQAVMKTEAPGRLWGTREVPRYERDDLPKNGIAVPASERTAIAAQLRAAGLPVDDQTIARIYFQRQVARN
jgi:hypothetical protein